MFFGVDLDTFVPIAITAYITWTLYDAGIRKGRYKVAFEIIRSLRLHMFLANVPFIVLVVAAYYFFVEILGLSWGWTSLLSSDGSTTNVNMIGLQYAWFVPVFAVLLIMALPILAQFEEELFRKGTKGLASTLIRSTIFGLVHMIAGISLGAALALIVAGLWFTYQYKRGGVVRSTAYHLAWNYTLIGIAIIAIAFSVLT